MLKKKILICLTTIFFVFITNSNSLENKILVKIENQIITSLDIINEYKYLVSLNPSLKNIDKERVAKFSKKSIIQEKIKKIEIRDTLTASMGINILIGLIGYLLRFYATTRLNTKIYASLSYFGIIMSYIYGILINKDKLTLRKVIGTLLIVIPNLWLVYTQ